MHIECPQCQASYDIIQHESDAVFVCHRCGQEFCAQQSASIEQAPVRKTAHLWPWFLIMLILLTSGGFWVQKDAWLDNRWFRSMLIQIGLDMPLRAKDWRIAPESVHPEWVTHKDGNRMLFVQGKIKNLLNSDMPLPRINIIFFSKTAPAKQIGTSTLNMILTAYDKLVSETSHIAAARDADPVAGLGSRSFTIVVESVPDNTGDFTLSPVPR